MFSSLPLKGDSKNEWGSTRQGAKSMFLAFWGLISKSSAFLRALWPNALITRLFDQSPAVLALFKELPFEQAPNYIVMVKKNYQFSNGQEKKEAQSWWRVGKAEQFSPVFQKKEK